MAFLSQFLSTQYKYHDFQKSQQTIITKNQISPKTKLMISTIKNNEFQTINPERNSKISTNGSLEMASE